MDKTLKYERAILELLQEYAQIKPVNWPQAVNQIVADRENHHYQLVRLGWKDGRHVHFVVFHFDLVDGKIWVQENRTDLNLEAELEALGVPAEDIEFALLREMEMA